MTLLRFLQIVRLFLMLAFGAYFGKIYQFGPAFWLMIVMIVIFGAISEIIGSQRITNQIDNIIDEYFEREKQ